MKQKGATFGGHRAQKGDEIMDEDAPSTEPWSYGGVMGRRTGKEAGKVIIEVGERYTIRMPLSNAHRKVRVTRILRGGVELSSLDPADADGADRVYITDGHYSYVWKGDLFFTRIVNQ